MKKKIVASLVLSGLVLSSGASNVYALDSAQTDTDVNFTAGDRPDPSKPEEGPKDPTPLDPDPKPLPEVKNVYVMHLPNISFGSNKTALKTTEYNAETEKRTANQESETFYMPHSVQVADLSGDSATTWKLSVQQDKAFEESTASGTPETLENTRIRIYGNTLTSTAYAAKDLEGKVAGVALDAPDDGFGATYSEIPVAGDTQSELVVLNNQTPGFTLNSYTSSVFASNYLEEDYTVEKTPAVGRYDGVRLNVPASDRSKATAYSSTLTWTLTVEP